MDISIPILVRRERKQGTYQHTLQAVFLPEWECGTELGPTTRRFARNVSKAINHAQRHGDWETVKRWCWNPPGLERVTVKFVLMLRRRTERMQVEVLVFRAFGHRVAIVPAMGNFPIDIRKGQTVSARVKAALTEYFRQEEKDDGQTPESINFERGAYLDTLDLHIQPHRGKLQQDEASTFAGLFGPKEVNGAEELDRTGRCLDALYPEDLPRAILRDEMVTRLLGLLADSERRPVLFVGPSQAGKTAVIQEVVWRRVDKRKRKHSPKGNTWLLSPQRLVSGMIYVGEWEQRLLAILKHADKLDLILYFDDLLGLFLAGKASGSSFNMADLLKPHIEQGNIRFIAETTPEGLRVLEETDRGFADLFQVVRLAEPAPTEVLRILMATVRRLERRHPQARFDPDAIATVHELQTRYVPGVAFPGKAVRMLEQLATRQKGAIGRLEVLQLFQRRSGLDSHFLDRAQSFSRSNIHNDFSRRLFGQPAAVDALANAILLARTRLNEPGRPLANLLFVGPSGVGKTEAAKVAATYLYGHEDRLVRFDMNEFVEARSVPRLIGTFHRPDGLLTSAIRRQPFCVLLLDEIEKAHPDLFDLLLQVLGEGRLTDALGRTVDFSNVLVLMTSNLGVREASRALGFGAAGASGGDREHERLATHYRNAARDFFRPEFFNRLDRVVAFGALDDDTLGQIAQNLLNRLLKRDGVRQRQCILDLHENLRAPLLAMGRDDLLGARALKRALERQITQPLARLLAAMPPDAPTLITVAAGDPLDVNVVPLINAEWNPDTLGEHTLSAADVPAVRTTLNRLKHDIDALEPTTTISLDDAGLSQNHTRYFILREMLQNALNTAARWQEDLQRPNTPGFGSNVLRHGNRKQLHLKRGPQSVLQDDFADDPKQESIARRGEDYRPGRAERLAFELAILQSALAADGIQEVELQATTFGLVRVNWVELQRQLQDLHRIPGLEILEDDKTNESWVFANEPTFTLRGLGAEALADRLCGAELRMQANGQIELNIIRRDGAPTSAPPPVLRVVHNRLITDKRSGLQLSGDASDGDLYRWTVSQLPLTLDEPTEDGEYGDEAEADHV